MQGAFDYEIICLPRSGSLWTSNFLSYGEESICIHEPQIVTNLDLSQLTQKVVGCCSSASILEPMGAPRRVFIDRDPAESWESLSRFTNLMNFEQFEAVADDYYQIDRSGALVVSYQNLTEEATCRKLWRFTNGTEMPFHRWLECRRMNVQVRDTAINRIRKVERAWR